MRSWWWLQEKKKQMALVFITVTMILHVHMRGCVGCVETERIGLLQLKSYLGSLLSPENGTDLDSWSDNDHKSDCCSWERVKCSDAIGGHIVDLSLGGLIPFGWNDDQPMGLNLTLFHSFPQLKTLDLSHNWFDYLFDPIHGYKSFQRLENLEILDFGLNDFNSSVLPFLSAAKSLKILNLRSNSIEGVFPPNGFKNLTMLEELDLSGNDIYDFEANDGFRTMKLKRLYLSGNKFSNTTQLKGIEHLLLLEVLSLADNQFNHIRSIQGLEHLVELKVLNLSNNNINHFEAGDGLITMKLRTLDLSYNNFSDDARLNGLEHLVELQVLSLSNEKFNHTRSIQVLKDMPKLQELDLSGNKFTDLDSLGSVFPSSLQVLNLKDNQLSLANKGYSKVCGLINLRELDLRNNALTNMPYCLGMLSRLQTLDLSNNQLNGNLSAFVSGLPSELEYLALLDNNFNDSFLFNSLVNHTRLTVFKLSSKVGIIRAQAEGMWVPVFQLKILMLHNFIFGRKIPGFLFHQHDLFYVDLSHNKLTGLFPTWLVQNNTRLQGIFLNNNLLVELQLPTLVHGLQALDISSNKIYDSIQEDIGIVFPKMRYMNFSSNQFHRTIPSSMGEMKDLVWLDMSSNSLYGQLPETFLSGCYSLTFLKLSNNKFQGKLFPDHANLRSLSALLVDGNNFTGCIGEGLLNSKKLEILDLSDNSFSGMLPLWIGRMLGLLFLRMKGNQLNGPFPHQLQSLDLFLLDISHNSFSGSIPRNLKLYVQQLRLQNNNFMGSIPRTLLTDENIEVLDLRNNNFSGNILITMSKWSSLRVLLLRNNSFQNHIPENICQLSEIGLLDLSHNNFSGSIRSCLGLGNMSFGAERYEHRWESRVQRSFSIPFLQSWNYTTGLNLISDLELIDIKIVFGVDFSTKNRYEAYQGDILHYMYGLDLSSNRLSGEIPVEIGNLGSIRSLNFSSNCLTGSIPYNFSKLKDLESLDLSNNKLYGSILPVLADLNSLGSFNVSFNNLSGEIPFKGHLGSTDETSYIGNAHLCGLPTNIICKPMRVSEASATTHAKEEEDDLIDMEWFYWTCGAVYISTSLALFAFLCIDSRWSQEWFYRVDLFIHHLQRYKRFAFGN